MELRALYALRDLRRSPLWRGEGLPEGRDRPLLIIPGFMAAPGGSEPLLHCLSRAGWKARIADVGRNAGPAYVGVDEAERTLLELSKDGPVTIVGHSRGGQFARILAVRHPELVTQVVAVGTPLTIKYPWFAVVKIPAEVLDRCWRAGMFGEVHPDREDEVDRDRHAAFPAEVELVSIFSRNDGIVDWRASIEPAAVLMEISASHFGLIKCVSGVAAIGQALARQD